MKEELLRPEALVELRAITGEDASIMRGVTAGERGEWRLGGLVTLAALAGADELPPAYTAVRAAAGSAATPSIRALATLGGNLLQRPRCWYFRNQELVCLKKGGKYCLAINGESRYHAILGGGPSWIVHPSSLATALVALDAKITIVTKGDPRELALDALFVGPKEDPATEHRLAPGEILREITLPPPLPGQRSVYMAVKEKQSHDWPLAEVALRGVVEGGVIKSARVVLGHVAPIPWRAREAERVLVGQRPSPALIATAAEAALIGAKPLKHNAYKIPLTRGLVRTALHRALEVPLPE
jgi:xanthine dehydrogenase YagS FAD-binding subunit